MSGIAETAEADRKGEGQSPNIRVKVLGQEGDEKIVRINLHEPCAVLLRKGLHALYGEPGPNANDYDLVFQGRVIEPLSKTVAEAGITEDATVSVLPKSISRG